MTNACVLTAIGVGMLASLTLASAQTAAPQAPSTPPPAQAAQPPRPTPPTRDPNTAGFVAKKALPDGTVPPADANGNFVIGPTHTPAPEMAVQDGAPQGSIVNYQSIYQTSQNIWRKIGKISRVYPGYQTVDTRFLEGAAEFFPRAEEAAKPEFEFKTPPRAAAEPILTKTVSIFFPSGSANLDENAKAVLDTQVVDLAATFGSAYMRISGNTDNVGSHDANVKLSRGRAEAVVRFLVSKGFDRNKFEVVGNGPDKPVASNDTDDGRAKNRRTDFEVIPR